MDTFFKFFYECLSQFFSGFWTVIKAIGKGVKQTFNIPRYLKIIHRYKGDFSVGEWILVGVGILLVLLLVAAFVLLIVFLIKKYIRFRKTIVEQESMLEEISVLNNKVASLVQEKDEILAMKVSHLGLKPGESDTLDTATSDSNATESEEKVNTTGVPPKASVTSIPKSEQIVIEDTTTVDDSEDDLFDAEDVSDISLDDTTTAVEVDDADMSFDIGGSEDFFGDDEE